MSSRSCAKSRIRTCTSEVPRFERVRRGGSANASIRSACHRLGPGDAGTARLDEAAERCTHVGSCPAAGTRRCVASAALHRLRPLRRGLTRGVPRRPAARHAATLPALLAPHGRRAARLAASRRRVLAMRRRPATVRGPAHTVPLRRPRPALRDRGEVPRRERAPRPIGAGRGARRARLVERRRGHGRAAPRCAQAQARVRPGGCCSLGPWPTNSASRCEAACCAAAARRVRRPRSASTAAAATWPARSRSSMSHRRRCCSLTTWRRRARRSARGLGRCSMGARSGCTRWPWRVRTSVQQPPTGRSRRRCRCRRGSSR